MLKLKNVLVPLDFSINSLQAFEYGQYIASRDNATIHLMHIIESFVTESQESIDREVIRQSRIRNAQEELEKFVFEVPRNNVKIIEALKEGVPEEEILKYARQNKIDLIVISSHGWTGLTNHILGNVASKIFHHSDIPIVCVKSINVFTNKNLASKSYLAENWVG